MSSDDNIKRWGFVSYRVQNRGTAPFVVSVKGRNRWALEALVSAGERGCTPISNPGPRWSGYVHALRAPGVLIYTLHEPHDGPFSGTHARYVLQSVVTPILSDGEAA